MNKLLRTVFNKNLHCSILKNQSRLHRNIAPNILKPLNVANVNNFSNFNISRRLFSTNEAASETLEFQAETRKLLDIVTNSIYTDKEVFIRELISNACDALEKLRYNNVNGGGGDLSELEINIFADETNNTLTIIDNGIGMTRADLVSNLGTIARSGSKQFVENLKSKGEKSSHSDGIIGQFGVGFYSSFMVSDSVSVESIPASSPGVETEWVHAHKWSSDGTGVFKIETIDKVEGLQNGSKITMHLKDVCKEFSNPEKIKRFFKKKKKFIVFFL
jgi:HSP90 family molecular chaperone